MTQIETNNEGEDKKSLNFIEQIVEADLKAGKNGGRFEHPFSARTERLPAYRSCQSHLHRLGIAEKFGGTCNLRFDDTNPVKEDVEYVDSIKEDIPGWVSTGATGCTMRRTTSPNGGIWPSA